MQKVRDLFFGNPAEFGLFLFGVGLFLLVTGILVPSFIFYWERWPRGASASIGNGTLLPGSGWVTELRGDIPPVTYDVTVRANGNIHVELISYDQEVPSEDWGVGAYFSRRLSVKEEVQIKFSNPSSNETIAFEMRALGVLGPGYPLQLVPESLPYVISSVIVGLVLLGGGSVLLKRGITHLVRTSRERGFWACFLIPTAVALDAVITCGSIYLHGLSVEANKVIVSLYLTGPWAVLMFYLAAIVLVFGLSFLMYSLMIKGTLSKAPRLGIAIVFSLAFGLAILPVSAAFFGFLGGAIPGALESELLLWLIVIGPPILLSIVLAIYLSMVVLETR